MTSRGEVEEVLTPRRRWTLRVSAAASLLVAFCLSGRLVAIQVAAHDEYLALRNEQSRILIPLPPERGRILDRQGKELAVSRNRVKSLFAVPPRIADPESLAETLGRLLRTDPGAILASLEKQDRQFVWVKRKISDAEMQAVEALDNEGLGFRDEPKRYYPHGGVAAHVLGFTGLDHKGLEGAEAAFDTILAGKTGSTWFARDAHKRLIALPDYTGSPPVDGHDVWLTIDAGLQYIVEKTLQQAMETWKPRGASAVMMDVETGGIQALAVRPTFDPNRFAASPKETRRNRVLTDPYEPGSIFKPLTLAMAYEEGAVRPDQRFDCGMGAFVFRDGRHRRTLHDYSRHGMLTAETILVKSSNIGITKIALLMSDRTLRRYVRAFGVGRRTGIEIRGEEAGWVAPRGWSFYSRTSVPWGQEVAMTPLQIVAAINVIASGGLLVRPTVFLRATARNGDVVVPIAEPRRKRVLSPKTAALVRRAMVRVVEEGTGRRARIDGYRIGGKTGTKSKRDKDGSYSRTRSVTSFVCFAPAERPRITLLVSLDEPSRGASAHHLTGGRCAAPVAKEILEQALPYLGIEPARKD